MMTAIPPTLDSASIVLGAELPPMKFEPTNVQLFRFSSVTWNAHRIHYDSRYASTEGYDDVVVHSHLLASFQNRCLADWAARYEHSTVTRFGWQNRAVAVVGSPLVCTGRVAEINSVAGVRHVTVELTTRGAGGIVCTAGSATVVFDGDAV